MGALFRFFENRIERRLASSKSKGVTPPAHRQLPVDDDRARIPCLGLREYWYPALPAKKVGRKPLFWTMLGEELVFFRDKHGQVAALRDVCPHRNASLSEGDCFYSGFVSCPYHGATFDGQGECVAFLCEGPDSKMVGALRVRSYPIRVLGGWVFIWMGQGEPQPIEHDVPPELFDPEVLTLTSYTYWFTNWMLAIENHSDSHNALYVHRDSLRQLFGLTKGRNRTPVGPRGKVIESRALIALHEDQSYYAQDGKVPHQLYYPGVDGVWPLHRWRLLWQWAFKRLAPHGSYTKAPEEWRVGHHLPGMVRTGGNHTRYAVAVEPDLSRIVYFYFVRPRNALRRLWEKLHFHTIHTPLEYNFSGQDNGAASPCRYWEPEYLSSTDAQVVRLRALVAHQSRDAQRHKAAGNDGRTEPPALVKTTKERELLPTGAKS